MELPITNGIYINILKSLDLALIGMITLINPFCNSELSSSFMLARSLIYDPS